MSRLVYGVGINDVALGSRHEMYELWRGVIERCFSDRLKKKYPTYKNCSCDARWVYFSKFLEDLPTIHNYGSNGWVLDKDLLIKGNKHYSLDTCCFIPEEINLLLIKSNKIRGDLPIGVHFDKSKNKFVSQMSVFGKRTKLGYFDNPNDAFYCYKQEKERHVKIVAQKYKGLISYPCYEALMNYTVSIND